MPAVVNVSKKDETLIQFQCDDSGVLMEISEFFTFFAESYKFHPAYKNKQWDGRIRLANLRNNTLPFGLTAHLAEFCKSRGYDITYSKEVIGGVRATIEELLEYTKMIPLSTRGKKIEMRDYQFDGFQQAIRENRSLLISPTGSGKSLIIYMLLRWYLDHSESDQMVLIVVPTTSLVEQMKKDFADYSEFDKDFDADKEVHAIYSGKEKHNFASRVVVTTWQSAVKLEKRWFYNFGMVIGDEAHQFKAKSLNLIMSHLVNAGYRIGTTGTIDNIQCNKLVLIGNFGPVHRVTSTKELMDADTLARLKINCIVLKYPDEIRKVVCRLDYQEEIDYIVAHSGRNRFIAKLAADQKGNTLVLYNYVEKHGKPLHKLISERVTDHTRKVFFVSGGVEADERERIREITECETNAIIVASLGTFAVGINIKNLHNIIFAAPTKSQIRVLQSIGRGLRKSDDGRPTTLFDISDNFAWKKSKNYTLNHAVERVKIYDSEQFDYKMFEVPIS
jgi:superfamily II DNA or RNA helicase